MNCKAFYSILLQGIVDERDCFIDIFARPPVIGSGSWDKNRLQEEIKKCKMLTDKPFAVNLMLLNPHCDELVDVVIQEEVKIVTTGAGSPGKYIEKLKNAGRPIK